MSVTLGHCHPLELGLPPYRPERFVLGALGAQRKVLHMLPVGGLEGKGEDVMADLGFEGCIGAYQEEKQVSTIAKVWEERGAMTGLGLGRGLVWLESVEGTGRAKGAGRWERAKQAEDVSPAHGQQVWTGKVGFKTWQSQQQPLWGWEVESRGSLASDFRNQVARASFT